MTKLAQGQLIQQASLADYTSWRVGGCARQLYKPADLNDLCRFLSQLPVDEPLLYLGLGSNLLVRDGGFAGTVILTQGALTTLDQQGEQGIYAAAGVACAQLARFAARHELAGLEFMAGIPGTVGGALRMNAGCFNGETWQYVTSVETVNRQGELQQRQAAEYAVAYRQVTKYEDEYFVAAHFALSSGDKQTSLAMIRDLLARRSATQPTGEYSCGSVFRNPPGDYAARLIESCGLKGYTLGDACVSSKHANFVINRGAATAADIENLITHVQSCVHDQCGVELKREVHIIGDTTP